MKPIKPKPKIQQISARDKLITVYCNTNGIIYKQNIRDAWGRRLPGYKVKFVNIKNGKQI